MDKNAIGRMIEGLSIVHECYKKAYLANGCTTENAKKMMEKIFQDTWKNLQKELKGFL